MELMSKHEFAKCANGKHIRHVFENSELYIDLVEVYN